MEKQKRDGNVDVGADDISNYIIIICIRMVLWIE